MSLLGGRFNGLAKVGIRVVHEAVDKGDVVMRVAICDKNFCKRSSQYATIAVITSPVKQFC